MSTFNSVDIFGSTAWPSKVTPGEFQSRNIYNSVAGISGAWSQNLGIAPRSIVVDGIMGASSIANLKTAISAVLSYVNEYSYPLTDNMNLPTAAGDVYSYCQLVSFVYGNVPGGQNSRFTVRSGRAITYYTARFVQLYPNTAQP